MLAVGCEKHPAAKEQSAAEVSDATDANAEAVAASRKGPAENIDAAEKAAAEKLEPVKCPVQDEIYRFRVEVRQALNNRRFDELETLAKEIRQKKEVFGNGSWKIVQFYAALDLSDDEPEDMWKLHEEIRRAWQIAKPESITARVALADFYVGYAWNARGSGFADTVTARGWELFRERLAFARDVLRQAKALPESDPIWAMVALVVARGQDWKSEDVETLADEAAAAEPTFWGYHTERATSLLPRWGGAPGDWERYAEKVAARPEGLGDEFYARIVMALQGYHDNIFRESKASWPKTRDGLKKLRQKYPESLELLSNCAKLAAYAQDREFAKEMFDQLGMRFVRNVWRTPERFVHVKNWAETGRW